MGALLAKLIPQSTLSTTIFPPKSKFDADRDMPDLTGKVVIVTGGNTGIGAETVRMLLVKNAKVYLAARSAEKAAKAMDRLEAETGKRPIFLKLDLADLVSVSTAATEFKNKETQLDVLFNNGGVMIPPTEQLTAQDFDLQFGTNGLGHFFFTQLLIPELTASHAATGVPARIINTSSSGHTSAPPGSGIEWDTLKGGAARDAQIKKWGMMASWHLYGQSKLSNILVSNYFARTYPGVIVSCAVHPGGIKTDLQRHSPTLLLILVDWIAFPVKMGAWTQLWAGTVASPEEINGKYAVPWARILPPSPQAQSVETEQELIDYMKKQVLGF